MQKALWNCLAPAARLENSRPAASFSKAAGPARRSEPNSFGPLPGPRVTSGGSPKAPARQISGRKLPMLEKKGRAEGRFGKPERFTGTDLVFAPVASVLTSLTEMKGESN